MARTHCPLVLHAQAHMEAQVLCLHSCSIHSCTLFQDCIWACIYEAEEARL